MNGNYTNGIVRLSEEFCNTYADYEKELLDFSERIANLEERSNNLTSNISQNGSAASASYEALEPDQQYHDENGDLIPYENLSVSQKRGLIKNCRMFAGDEEIELNDAIAEAQYDMEQSAKKFVKDLSSKLDDIKRNRSLIDTANISLTADRARNGIIIDDCIRQSIATDDVNEKANLFSIRQKCEKDNKKINLLMSINSTVIDASNVYEKLFENVIDSINKSIGKNNADENLNFVNADQDRVENIDEKLDILGDLGKLMSGFTDIKKEYNKEKELIKKINDKCAVLNKVGTKDIKNFVKNVKKITKEFGELIVDIEKENERDSQEQTQEEVVEEQTQEEEIAEEQTQGEENVQEQTQEEEVVEEQTQEEEVVEEQTQEEEVVEEQTQEEENVQEQTQGEENVQEQTQGEENVQERTQAEENTESISSARLDTNDPIYKVNRTRMASASLLSHVTNVGVITLVAATALGLGPVGVTAGAVIAGTGVALQGAGAISTVISRNATKWKLKRIAKKLSKEGYGDIRLGDPDFDKGTIAFELVDDDERIPIIEGSEISSNLMDRLQTLLDKSFKNDCRDCVREDGVLSNIWLKDMPKVTPSNLQAAYATTGGILAMKDESLGFRNVWSTTSRMVGRHRDSLMEEVNHEEAEVDNVEVDDLTDNAPNVQTDGEEEIVVGTDLDEDEIEIPEVETQRVETPDVEIPEVETQSAEIPEEAQEQVADDLLNPDEIANLSNLDDEIARTDADLDGYIFDQDMIDMNFELDSEAMDDLASLVSNNQSIEERAKGRTM